MINHNVFDILTPEACYWIGFITADGCISKTTKFNKKNIEIKLNENDFLHLYKFRTFLNANNNIWYINKDNAFKIRILSNILYDKLIYFGLCERKSFNNFKIDNEILINSKDFWRGVIDGDGCISYDYNNIFLVGQYNLINQFNDFVYNNVGIKHKVCTHQTIYRVTYSSVIATKLIEILYKNAEIYLDRKYDIAIKIIDRKL